MKTKKAVRFPGRRCKECGARERLSEIGGVPFSNLTLYSSICVDCINKELRKSKHQL